MKTKFEFGQKDKDKSKVEPRKIIEKVGENPRPTTKPPTDTDGEQSHSKNSSGKK